MPAPQKESCERELLEKAMSGPQRFVVLQGLPAYYFSEYAKFFGCGRHAGRRNEPVFICLSAAAVSQFAVFGAECYALNSIPGIDRKYEIRAYERAHAAFAVAHSRMSTVETDLVQLCVDDDLPILALSFFLPEAEAFLAEAFGRRKIILPMQNADDSYRIIGSKVDCAFFHVRGDYAEILEPGAIDRGAPSAAGDAEEGHESPADRAEALFREIKAFAEGQTGGEASIGGFPKDAGGGTVIVNCSYTPEHFSFECTIEICRALRERQVFPVFIVKNDASAEFAKSRGLDALVLNELTAKPTRVRTMKDGLPRFREWPYREWARSEVWPRRLSRAIGYFEWASRLIRALRPRAVLTFPYASHSGRALRLAAHHSGIPAFSLILLGLAGHARGFSVIDRFTTHLAYGDEARELMTAFGVAPERIIVTGNPRYDSIVSHLKRRSEYRRAILAGRNENTKIALVATTGLLELDKLWLDEACRSAHDLGIRLLLKPHPSIGLAPYKQWLSGDPLVSGWEGSLEEAISACDVLLTDYSSTGFEAILYHRPLIVVNFSPHEFSYRWEDEGVGVRVSNATELHEQLRSVAENRFAPEVLATQQRVVSKFNHLNDGRAGERIVDLLAGSGRPK